jgi:outer membrane protein insertion porin family
MRRLLRSFAALWLVVATLLVAAPGLVATASAQEGSRVGAIEFKGNRTLDSEVLRQSLRTKKGAPLDESLLNEDVRTLYELFSSVQLQREQVGDEVNLTFVVAETATANDVEIRGASGVSENDVRAVIDTKRGRPVADFRLQNDAKKIERLYRMKGYHFVEVSSAVTEADGGRSVVFTIFEGPKVQVDSITFRGNEHLPSSKLLDHMATKQTGFLGLRGADFVEETLLKDRGELARFYRYEGYLNAQVRIADVTPSADRKTVAITMEVEEGPPFVVGKIDFVGVQGYPGGADALRTFLRLETGKRYRGEDLNKTLNALEAAYHDEGYFAVAILPEDRPSTETATVDFLLKIDEQSKVRVRDVKIVGNEITQDKVIRRESSVTPGEVLNQNEIRKTKNRLLGLGYFTDVDVSIVKPEAGDDPNQRDVQIAVDDTAKTGQIRFAVGASSDLGLIASFTVTKRNFDWRDWPEHFADVFTGRAFTGAGQTFQLELSPGTSMSTYRLAFTEPWLFDKPIEFGWDLFLSQFTRFDYDVDRRGLDLTLGRRFRSESTKGDDTVFGITGTTRIEAIDLSNVSKTSAPTAFLAEGDNTLIAERLAFRIDRLDSALSPTDGWYAQFTPEFGLAGDVRLFKAELEAKRYFTLWKTEDERVHTLAFGGRVGRASPQGSSVKADRNVFDESFVPTYERFFAGGASSVRGFAFGGAGPHGEGNPFFEPQAGENAARRDARLGNTVRSILENDGDPLGGDLILLANVEYGFPVYEDILRGVVFVDSGVVRDSTSSSHGLDEDEVRALRRRLSRSDEEGGSRGRRRLAREIEFDEGDSFFQDLRVSVGFGFRIKIPGLSSTPIALDFGFPLRKQDGDDTQVLSFSIARDF